MGEKIPGEKIGVDGMLAFVPPSQLITFLANRCVNVFLIVIFPAV